MEKIKKYGIIKNVSIAAACVCAFGIVTGFTMGCVGLDYGTKSVGLAQKNGYDVANANFKVEKINIYTEMYNHGLMSDDEFRY